MTVEEEDDVWNVLEGVLHRGGDFINCGDLEHLEVSNRGIASKVNASKVNVIKF